MKIKCPICGKELTNLNSITCDSTYKFYYEFWCDDCNADITINAIKDEYEEKK